MKKIVAFILVIVLMLSMVSCSGLPQGLQGIVDAITGGHQHEFVVLDTLSTPAGCLTDGYEVKVCSCGERQENVLRTELRPPQPN